MRSKSFLISLLLVSFFLSSSGQGFTQYLPTGYGTHEYWMQLFNTSNVYRNVPTATSLANTGAPGDTLLPSKTIYQTTAAMRIGKANADTFQPQPLNGNGVIQFTAYAWHMSKTSTVSAVVTATLQKSNTDVPQNMYVPVVGATVFTLTPTQAADTPGLVPIMVQWDLTQKQGRYYNIKWTTTSADTVIVFSNCYYQPTTSWPLK